MKAAKYIGAATVAVLAVWFLVSTFRGVREGMNGPVQVATGDRDADKPTADHVNAWRDQAGPVMLASATNDIVGFRRMIDSTVDDSQDAVSNWTGSVKAEYINQAGGVDRTNFLYLFRVYGGTVHVEPDYYKMAYNASK